jgi:hypothetical protein
MAGNLERKEGAPRAIASVIPEGRPRTAPLRWFVQMPIAMLKDTSIAADSKVLAGLLLHYDGPKGCFPRIDSLVKDLGVSKYTIIRSLEELERYGFLTREKRGRNNIYHLTPAYVPPARPHDITLTGELDVENRAPAKPVKRKTLHKRRPDPELPLASKKVSPVQPIASRRAAREKKPVAPVRPITGSDLLPTDCTSATDAPETSDYEQVAPVQPIVNDDEAELGCTGATETLGNNQSYVAPLQLGHVSPVQLVRPDASHGCDLDITNNQNLTNNQQQQDPAAAAAEIEPKLVSEGVAPEDAEKWARDLLGLPVDGIIAALRIMRAKPAFRRREIDRPGAYMRKLCQTQVHTDRLLAEHDARKTGSRRERGYESSTVAGRAPNEKTEALKQIKEDVRPPGDPHDAAPPIDELVIGSEAISLNQGQKTVAPDRGPVKTPIEAELAELDSETAARAIAYARKLCSGGPNSPAWAAAVSIALKRGTSPSAPQPKPASD